MQIRRAVASEAETLTAIALAAKRHWGYPEAWMRQWVGALTITAEYVWVNAVFVAEAEGKILGWGAVRMDGPSDAWLDHIWVRPEAMGRGVGWKLFAAGETAAREAGARRLCIEADPHAEVFYLRMGARTIGRTPAFMDGQERYLPRMEKRLTE